MKTTKKKALRHAYKKLRQEINLEEQAKKF